jgi:hypothetical protein
MNKRSEREMNVIGIDVSKAKLDVAWLSENNKIKTKVIENQLTGWEELLDWAKSHSQAEVQQKPLLAIHRVPCWVQLNKCLNISNNNGNRR